MKLSPQEIAMKQARLAELEQMKSNPALEQEDLLWNIEKSIGVQGVLGFGNAIGNQIGKAANTLSGGAIPHKPLVSGEGPVYEAGAMAGEVAPYLIPGTAAGRVGLSTVGGALTSDKGVQQGGVEGALFGLGGEAAGPAIKGAGSLIRNKVIEPLTLDKKAIEMSNLIKETYEKAKESAWGTVKPMFEKWNKEPLLKTGPYGETIGNRGFSSATALFEEKKDLFTPDAKRLKKEFDRNPNIENAQALVEKLGIDERKISRSGDAAKELKESTYKEAKEYIREAIREKMESVSPGFTEAYLTANKKYAKDVGPYYSSDPVESAAAGNIERIPDLYSGIEEASKKQIKGYPGIGEGHDLLGMGQDMSKALGVAEMVPQGASKLAPFLGTPLARETVYGGLGKSYDKLNPILRAMLQSQATQQNNY